jgi:hypothetical protein
MNQMKRDARVFILTLIALLAAFYSPANAQCKTQSDQIPSTTVACYFIGRTTLNANGQGLIYGYFTDISEIGSSDTLFNGQPSEKTAFFTFRSSAFTLSPLPPNGDIGLNLVSAGTFDIYYNPAPNGDWTNPDTFSSGQPVAHFVRPEVLFVQILPSDPANPPSFEFEHAVTETLISSRSFTFKGHDYDFSTFLPGGITLNELFSNTGVQGTADFPTGLVFAGNCFAVANEGE